MFTPKSQNSVEWPDLPFSFIWSQNCVQDWQRNLTTILWHECPAIIYPLARSRMRRPRPPLPASLLGFAVDGVVVVLPAQLKQFNLNSRLNLIYSTDMAPITVAIRPVPTMPFPHPVPLVSGLCSLRGNPDLRRAF